MISLKKNPLFPSLKNYHFLKKSHFPSKYIFFAFCRQKMFSSCDLRQNLEMARLAQKRATKSRWLPIFFRFKSWLSLCKSLPLHQRCQFRYFFIDIISFLISPKTLILFIYLNVGVDLAALTLHHQQQQQAALFQSEDNSRGMCSPHC